MISIEVEVRERVAAELEFRKRVVLADGGQVEKGHAVGLEYILMQLILCT